MYFSIRLERLDAKLREISGLIDLYTNRDPTFPARVMLWLDSVEKVMSELRLPEGAELSVFRGNILKAEDTARSDEGKQTRRAMSQARNAAACEALESAERLMLERVREAEERLTHFENKLVEATTAAALLRIIPRRGPESREIWLRGIWGALVARQEIRPTTVYLAAALKSVDRLYVLDRVMNRLTEQDLPVL